MEQESKKFRELSNKNFWMPKTPSKGKSSIWTELHNKLKKLLIQMEDLTRLKLYNSGKLILAVESS